VISKAVEQFDARQPDRFLPADALDDLIQAECRTLLEESLGQPDVAAELTACIELGKETAAKLECDTTDVLPCGCDRRTLLFLPTDKSHKAAIEFLRALQPLASVVPAPIDDVLVVSEEAGISPQSLARGLGRVFPGIGDAASRLLTRNDVEWQTLL
jgi:hypothetical protein